MAQQSTARIGTYIWCTAFVFGLAALLLSAAVGCLCMMSIGNPKLEIIQILGWLAAAAVEDMNEFYARQALAIHDVSLDARR